MKQTLGRQVGEVRRIVVSTLPVTHILLLQHLHEPPSPVSTVLGLCGSHPAASVMKPCMRAGAGPCTLVVRDHGIYQRRSRRIG